MNKQQVRGEQQESQKRAVRRKRRQRRDAVESRDRRVIRALQVLVPLLLALLVVVQAVRYSAGYHHNVWDDSYISLQYAKNLALGHGLVFNVAERVEGYTNFLWIVWLAPWYRLAGSLGVDFVAIVKVWGIGLTVVNLLLLARLGRVLLGSGLAALLPAVLYAADEATPFFAIIGMENPLQQLCVLCAMLAWASHGRWRAPALGLALAGAVLTRPDAVLFALVWLGWDLWELRGRIRADPSVLRGELRALGASYGLALLVGGVYFAWRFSYYGYLLPNTFYAKVSGDSAALQTGWAYLLGFLRARAWLPVVALLALRWHADGWVRRAATFGLLHAAYVVYVGGDFYPGSRFLVVLAPLSYLLAARLVGGVGKWLAGRWAWVATTEGVASVALGVLGAIGLVFLPAGTKYGPYEHEIVRWSNEVDELVRYARFVGSLARPGDSIFCGTIGAFGYFTNLRVIDVYGLVDPVIAHGKAQGAWTAKPGHQKEATPEYGLAQQPTFLPFQLYDRDFRPDGYYLHPWLPVGGGRPFVWRRDPLAASQPLPGTAVGFEPDEVAAWTREGEAFEATPARGARPHQGKVFGQQGAYASSFHPRYGDASIGKLVSPPLALQGELMVLDVGGGSRERGVDVHVDLLVAGRVVLTATGNESEALSRRVWDISPWRGREAVLALVDEAQERWGHIMVDSVRQLPSGAAPAGP